MRWIVATTIGYSVGFVAGFVMGSFLGGNVIIGAGIGAIVAVAQMRALRRHGEISGRWAAANVIGLSGGLLALGAVSLVTSYPFDLGWPHGAIGWAVAFAVGGAATGSLQRELLPGAVNRTGWVAASALGWGLSALALSIPPDMTSQLPVVLVFLRNGFMAPALAGLILGVTTGTALLMRAPQPAVAEHTS